MLSFSVRSSNRSHVGINLSEQEEHECDPKFAIDPAARGTLQAEKAVAVAVAALARNNRRLTKKPQPILHSLGSWLGGVVVDCPSALLMVV